MLGGSPRTATSRVIYFLLALGAPVLGALLYRTLHRHERAFRLVDGFVYVAVPSLVAIQVLPEVWGGGGPGVLLLVAAGALVPTVLERASRPLAKHTDDLTILVTLGGLVLHEALEGAALAPTEAGVDPAFAWAVIFHRVPVGLIIWWLVRPRHGIPLAAAAVSSLVFATLGGALVGREFSGSIHGAGFELFEAFVAGTLLHVVFHQGRHDHDHGNDGGHHLHDPPAPPNP